MSATGTVVSGVLGAGGFVTAGLLAFTTWRDRHRSARKQEGSIQLDETTRVRIAAEAAQINSDERIAVERWWKEQFDAVKTELVEEQRRRRQLTKWAAEHQKWDERAWTLALKTDPLYPAPPLLEGE